MAATSTQTSPSVKNNIIILTHGWTGSSVFSGLLGRAGYWLGAETMQKVDYNTYENLALVGINNKLIDELGGGLNHEHRFSESDVAEITRRAQDIDLGPLRQFVGHCEGHTPWLWKDPRLTWTIRIWARVLELERTSFLILTRDAQQAWISANMRRHVQSPRFTREYKDGITASNIRFLKEVDRPLLELSFEDLLLTPERTLERLNVFFGTALTMDDLQTVCKEPLYRKSRGFKDLVLATLIYLKNYGERDGRGKLAATR